MILNRLFLLTGSGIVLGAGAATACEAAGVTVGTVTGESEVSDVSNLSGEGT